MKVKVIYFSTLILTLLLALSLTFLEKAKPHFRFHHHTQAIKKVEPKDPKSFQSHLPIISIDTHKQAIPLKRETEADSQHQVTIKSQIKLFDELDRSHSLSETPREVSDALIAYRGNSSRHFDKKSLKIKFINKKKEGRDLSLAGMPKEAEWVLHGPFLDRTLIRNYLSYNIAGEIMTYAPNVRYCELVINGQYQGLYLIVENIKQGPHRVNIDKSDKRATQTPYIVEWDRSHKAKNLVENYSYYIRQAGVSGLDIRYPGLDRLTNRQAQFIQKDISRIEKVLYSYDFKQYPRYIDRESFAEYFIINEFFRNADAGKFSTYLYKDLRDKMKLVVWDFNNAFDNQIETAYDESGFTMLDVPWFSMLLKDPAFVDLVIKKYHELRKNKLKTDYLTKYVDQTVDFLGPAIERNNAKWGYVFEMKKPDSFNYLKPYNRNLTSYNQSVKQLKDFIKRRGSWLDRHIETLYQYSSTSKNANTLLE
ncbi:CotH kinase family protein [Streptococcus oricebi]|uniref:Spore coat protein CotH n=1 Tax=Streptococcus oricebi TaxID=1547447 RepID=A0ABS5B0G9_9STRE|nr:CotH kinase family protein [Streptococcus oricebi]MBP2622322.1 spore coat protein CotH [Streptococcus oricebi]